MRAAEVVFLDDVEACVETARECGIHAILFRDTARARAIADLQACLAAGGRLP